MGIVSLCQKIEKESSPRVQFDRLHGAGGDLTLEIFLNDLVDARAHVPESLKREFLMTWADEPIVFDATPGEGEEGVTHDLVVEFAAMDPVIDLGPNWT
ncbi:hypothetical protein [uncultured Corynebacterium sp.]|uniref:hypothetical protein n=1 Tax=uncultured Corynebacterium sp. TaxID=159447 RepID=UPI000E180448|nr:hypothetical protein [uncultured Corynebacterium sp.]STC40443.1 Uncharacterised protein [Corynebacterium amycolatum]